MAWRGARLAGDLRLLRGLAGDWPDEDFLVVGPGQSIVPSDDAQVIRAET